MHIAAIYLENELLLRELIRAGGDLNRKNSRGQTPLHLACIYNKNMSLTILKEIIKKSKNIDELTNNGSTALMLAIEFKQRNEIVNHLIKVGAGTNKTNHDGMTPLHYVAFGEERGAVIKNLLARGAKLTVTNNNGDTPLHFAAARNSGAAAVRIVELYAQHKISMDLVNSDQRTPLHHACHFNNNSKVIEALLAHGADINSWDREGRTPLDYLKINDFGIYEKIATAHLNKVPVNKILNLATDFKHLITKGEDIN